MRVHNLRKVRLNFDGKTLVCEEHGPLDGKEAAAALSAFAARHGASESVLERSARLNRWPTRWGIVLLQKVQNLIDPPRCQEV